MVSIIALVVATAGTATAATKVLIKSSSQVRAGSLDASDLTLPAPTTMALMCSVGPVKFGAANARIKAVQVGSLTETVS